MTDQRNIERGMNAADLTYEQRYQVPIAVIFSEAKIEYSHCGSHEISLEGTTNLVEARLLRDRLNALPGIDTEPKGN